MPLGIGFVRAKSSHAGLLCGGADWVLRNRANRVRGSVCLCECGARAPMGIGFNRAKSIALPLLCGVGNDTPRRVRMALKAFGMIGNLRDAVDCELDILARNL